MPNSHPKKTNKKLDELDGVEVIPHSAFRCCAVTMVFPVQRSIFGVEADSRNLIKLKRHLIAIDRTPASL
ncbi:hypothetical protein KIN20_015470 [Parelaphostrongylus tenuis]|uniref:Uncharacterized protein n=1 Tax=Parelaphostrongylus tenuis TaxID=148309 RepID=A0AAD5MYH9_PARTN|nr:hypothetical protein KIN20_015470 [Parelaphostrongylus tenuis]